jgi:hypothetical protein
MGHFIYDLQTLIAGALASIAAAVTAYIVWRSARLPVEAQAQATTDRQERQKHYIASVLSSHLGTLAARARQAEGTIKVAIAANANVNDDTRKKTTLKLHSIVDDWEFMSLIPEALLEHTMRLRRQIDDHNFDMERAGGAFGSQEFRHSILTRINTIQAQAALRPGAGRCRSVASFRPAWPNPLAVGRPVLRAASSGH